MCVLETTFLVNNLKKIRLDPLKKTILITGGTGLIGSHLADRLADQGHEVRLLSRSPKHTKSPHAVFGWNIKKQSIDDAAFDQVDIVIALAGASVAGARWSKRRKQILEESRVNGNHLILQRLKARQQRIEQFIGASAIGYYGDRGEEWLDEESLVGEGFMPELCARWESSQQAFVDVAQHVMSIRIGLVLAKREGVLPTLARSVIAGIGTCLGSGNQYMSWIHVDDLINIFTYIIHQPSKNSIYNAVAPSPVKHRSFMQSLIQVKGGLGWLIPVPTFFLKLVMGEMSHVVLDSTRVSPKAMIESGYTFGYTDLHMALRDLLT